MQEIQVPHDALVLIGDGRRALFLRNRGASGRVELVTERVLEQDNPPTREQGTDRPGRYPGVDGSSRSALDETDWHQLAEERFAKDIAAALYREAHAGTFAQLIVVAPPKILGTLRTEFHKEVAERILAEVPKDLTAHSLDDIARILS